MRLGGNIGAFANLMAKGNKAEATISHHSRIDKLRRDLDLPGAAGAFMQRRQLKASELPLVAHCRLHERPEQSRC